MLQERFVEVCSTKEITDLKSNLKLANNPWHKFHSAFVVLIEDDITESKGG